MNWDDLKVLLAISRAGSLTGAAHVLGIDQSTASRRISALEADLGALMFVRSKTGFTPTEVGERVIARALEIEGRAERLQEDVATGDHGPAGLVRLIGNPWTLMQVASVTLPPLMAAHPKLEVRMIAGSRWRSLARSEAAVALWFELPPHEGEFAMRLGEVAYAVYASRDADPEGLDWVSFWDDEAPRRELSRWIQRTRKPDEHLKLTATDSSLLQAGIRAGLGKGLLPMRLAERDPTLVRLGSGPPDLERALHLHAHPDTIQTARVQVVMQALRATFEEAFGAPRAADAVET